MSTMYVLKINKNSEHLLHSHLAIYYITRTLYYDSKQ